MCGIMSHSGLCRIRGYVLGDYVTFRIMSPSNYVVRDYVVRINVVWVNVVWRNDVRHNVGVSFPCTVNTLLGP